MCSDGDSQKDQNPSIPIDDALHIDDQSYDSAISEGDLSDTTTLASEITAYRFENGRRYHAYKEGQYWGPNDEKQNNQLEIAHHMFSILLDQELHLAPIGDEPHRVLDLGTGTGIWAIDFADKYPSAEIIGTELSPIQPNYVPPNLRFEIDDATDTWTYKPNYFDYVHIRLLYGSIDDWPRLYKQAFDHIKPGGWIEQLEIPVEMLSDDGTADGDHVFAEWGKLFIECGEKNGRTFKIMHQAADLMKEAGFVNITEKKYKIPIGTWCSGEKNKNLGKWNRLHCEEGIEGWAMYLLTRVMNWPVEDVHVLLGRMREALRDKKLHAYTPCRVVYAQKPE